jgi:hypothetical protein
MVVHIIRLIIIKMPICRTYENLDLFITFTCYANWLEIRRELRKKGLTSRKTGQTSLHAFLELNFTDMLLFIKSGKSFGRTISGIL